MSSGDTPEPTAAAQDRPVIPGQPAGAAHQPWSVPYAPPRVPAQAMPVSGSPFYYQYPPMEPAPRRRRAWVGWLLGSFLLSLLMIVTCSFGAVAGGLTSRSGDWRASGGGASPTVRPSLGAPPAANASKVEWRTWARTQANTLLKSQSEALVKGQEPAFVALADPAKRDLVRELSKRFKVLRAMGVGAFDQRVSGVPDDDGTRAWRTEVEISYCFGPGCTATDLPVEMQWTYRGGKFLLTDLENAEENWNGPRPWEISDLSAKAGTRTVVAATKNNAWRLDEAVRSADRAAAIADKFAKWHETPTRFVIFLAGPSEWKVWYGKEEPNWAAAWTVPIGTYESEVVVRTEVVRQSSLEALLTHELTHVTSLAGDREGATNENWWLIEGLADYAAFGEKPNSQYDAIVPIRRFVQGGRFNNDVAVKAPTDTASLEDASARYGIAFLAVRRIAEKYGDAKMLDFFGAVVHKDEALDAAARETFGVPWSTVNADCARYVRDVV